MNDTADRANGLAPALAGELAQGVKGGCMRAKATHGHCESHQQRSGWLSSEERILEA